MVSTLCIVFLFLSLLICLALPFVGPVWLRKRGFKIGLPFIAGVLAFMVSQQVLRIPLLQLLRTQAWFISFTGNTILYGLFLGLTAGIFEEAARFIAFTLLKNNRRYEDGVIFGFGHGGIEAVAIVGLSLLNSIIIIFLYNQGSLSTLGMSAAQEAATVASLEALTPGTALMSGIERILAMGMHISLSIVVLTGFVRGKKWLYLLLAILAHTMVDAAVVIIPAYLPMSVYALEGLVLVMTALLSLWAWKLKKYFPEPEIALKTPPTEQIPGADTPEKNDAQ